MSRHTAEVIRVAAVVARLADQGHPVRLSPQMAKILGRRDLSIDAPPTLGPVRAMLDGPQAPEGLCPGGCGRPTSHANGRVCAECAPALSER